MFSKHFNNIYIITIVQSGCIRIHIQLTTFLYLKLVLDSNVINFVSQICLLDFFCRMSQPRTTTFKSLRVEHDVCTFFGTFLSSFRPVGDSFVSLEIFFVSKQHLQYVSFLNLLIICQSFMRERT